MQAGHLPKESVLAFVMYSLNKNGITINEIQKSRKKKLDGDPDQRPYRDMPVWSTRMNLIQYVAREMKIPPSLLGRDRESDDLYKMIDTIIASLRHKGFITDWDSKNHLGIFRLCNPDSSIQKPVASVAPTEYPKLQGSIQEDDLKQTFLSILRKASYASTYKFALARALLDFCRENKHSESGTHTIKYEYLATKFFEYYWYQIHRFKIRQNFRADTTPNIVSAIEDTFKDSKETNFKKISSVEKRIATGKIMEGVFGNIASRKSIVVPAFQKIKEGKTSIKKQIFYDFDNKKRELYLKPEAFRFFRDNHEILLSAVYVEWARILEKINGSLPKIVSKIIQDPLKRSSLIPIRKAYENHTCHCFYCCTKLERGNIHVDHFLPWSYIFEDEAWNLVLACERCNLRKHNSLAQPEFRDDLIKRNGTYRDRIGVLERSLREIDTKRGWKMVISNHYENCIEYGFNQIHMP